MHEAIATTPWVIVMPALAFTAFLIGLAWKSTQDKTVAVVKNLTIKPGDLSVSDLQEYARTR